ncbi:MAG TPA: AfsR/SARP family transcriptional regulator [Natronosporangium sp.]
MRIEPDSGHAIAGRRKQTVLAMLLVNLGQAVSTDRLIDAIWTDTPPPATAREQAQNCAAAVRRTLLQAQNGHACQHGGRAKITTERHGYRLTADPETVDAVRFERIVQGCLDAPVGRDQEVVASLRAGLDLWTGTALAGLRSLELQAEAARMEELKLLAIEELAGRELRLGHSPAMSAANLLALTKLYPYRERLWLLHMEALRRCGRLTEALARFREFRSILVADHGIEPGPEIRAKEREILRQNR